MKWYQPNPPSQMPTTPWLHPDAVKFLESILERKMSVIEFGGGGSTLWFSERVKNVTTIERNEKWLSKLQVVCKPNVKLLKWLVCLEPEYDILFIDGEPIEERGWWLKYCRDYVKPNGWVILDNANRPEYSGQRRVFAEIAELVHTVDGNEGPTNYLVTEFWRLK